jgi:hypothetical protein
MMEALRTCARPVVRVRRDEEADAYSSAGRVLDASDHSSVCDIWVHDVECLASAIEKVLNGGGDGSASCRCVVKDGRRHRIRTLLVFRKQRVQIASRNATAQPAKARHEHELKLRDDRAGDAHEEIVEAAVLEVILDSGASDPADTAIHDDDFAVVDVT